MLTQLQQPLKTPGQLAASAALALGHASLALWGREAQGQGAAGEQLGELPPPAAVEAVAALLQDKDVKVGLVLTSKRAHQRPILEPSPLVLIAFALFFR